MSPDEDTNNYTNNYKRNEVHSYNSQDGTRLHATADMNGYSDYTISQRVKWKVSQHSDTARTRS